MQESIKRIYEETKRQLEEEQATAISRALQKAEEELIGPRNMELEREKQEAITKIEQDYEERKRKNREEAVYRTEAFVKQQFADAIKDIEMKLSREA